MIALRGGRICDPEQGLDAAADLYIRDGAVSAIMPPGSPAPAGEWTVYDCTGLLVVPGPIDTLCRCSVRDEPWRQSLADLALAAARGGYTAMLAFTGSADPAAIAAARCRNLPVRLHPVAALTVGGRLADLGLLADAGAVAFSDWPEPVRDARLMRTALEYAGGLGLPVIVHPEDADLSRDGVMHEGARSFGMGLRGIPTVAETVAVTRDALLQGAVGGRLHFAALSAAAALPLLGGATAAVMAHHLLLTEEAVAGYNTAAKIRPPLRTAHDRAGLLEATRSGRLLLASGHDPCAPEEKDCEYDYARFGAGAIETALAAALECLDPVAFVRATASGPAAAFGLPGGTLRPGTRADVAVFDTAAGWLVPRPGPLAGTRLSARATLLVVGGKVVGHAQ